MEVNDPFRNRERGQPTAAFARGTCGADWSRRWTCTRP